MADVTITLRPQIVEATLTGGTLTVVIETGTSLLYDSAGTAQTLITAHTHAGTTNGPKLVQANTHESPDTDAATTSLHHTLGTGANQALPGNTTIPAAQVNSDWNASGTVAEILNKPTIPTQYTDALARTASGSLPVVALGTISGTQAIDWDGEGQAVTATVDGTATTLAKGTGWPATGLAEVRLTLTVTVVTAITWTIATDVVNWPTSFAVGKHILVLSSLDGVITAIYSGQPEALA